MRRGETQNSGFRENIEDAGTAPRTRESELEGWLQSCAPLPPHLTSLPSGDCVPSPCHNGGTCLEEEEGVRCLCLPGYGGDLCDVGECVEGLWLGDL